MPLIFTEQEANKYLKEQNPYKSAIESINTQVEDTSKLIENQYKEDLSFLNNAYNQSRFGIGLDFAKDMSSAISGASEQQKSFLNQSSALGTGQRSEMSMGLNKAVVDAYDSFVRNYATNKQNVNQSFSSNVNQLENNKLSQMQSIIGNAQSALNDMDVSIAKDAKNYAALGNAPLEFLQYLFKNNPDAFSSGPLEKYTHFNSEGERVLDDLDTLTGSFFDKETGELTDTGKEFYSTILFGLTDEGNFSSYLMSENRGLYDWAYNKSQYGDESFVNNYEEFFTALGIGDVVKSGTYDTTTPLYNNGHSGMSPKSEVSEAITLLTDVANSSPIVSNLMKLAWEAAERQTRRQERREDRREERRENRAERKEERQERRAKRKAERQNKR